MEAGDWVTLIVGVLTAGIAIWALVVAIGSRNAARKSAEAAEGSLQISRSMRMLTAESVRMQAEQHDDALKPDFVATPKPEPIEIDGKTAWRIVMRVTHGPPKAKLHWSASAEAKTVKVKGIRTVHIVAGGIDGPLEANVGDEFGALVRFPMRLELAMVSATITVWSEEVDHETGRPTGRSWTPWIETIRFGPEPDA